MGVGVGVVFDPDPGPDAPVRARLRWDGLRDVVSSDLVVVLEVLAEALDRRGRDAVSSHLVVARGDGVGLPMLARRDEVDLRAHAPQSGFIRSGAVSGVGGVPAMEFEFHQLDRKYGDSRLIEPARQSRLIASLAEHGQQSPVWVVGKSGKPVLVDGYRRCDALEDLGCDTVQAIELELGESEALLLAARPEGSGRRSAIEEARHLRELHESFGLSQQELAIRFGRSRSWISRRLALAGELPQIAVDAVRKGAVCAHAAMKYLSPLARANADQCTSLVGALGGSRLSERELGRIYAGWRDSPELERERIVEAPLTYLAAQLEAADPELPSPGAELDEAMRRDLESLAAIAHRVRRHARLRSGVRERWPDLVQDAWEEAGRAFDLLGASLREAWCDAGS